MKSAVGGKMFLDCFQLDLEKVKLFESADRPNTTHKLVIRRDHVSVTLELVWTTGFPSFGCVWTWTELWLCKSYFCRSESYIIEGDSCPRSCYFLWFTLLSVYGSCFQLFIGPFDMIAVSQFVGVGVGRRARTMDRQQALYFFSSPRLAFRTSRKCHVCLAWLIKRLLCRLQRRKFALSSPVRIACWVEDSAL